MRTRRRALSIGAAALLLTLGTAACGSEGGDDPPSATTTSPPATTTVPAVIGDAAPIPVSADALPAGTELGNGFSVPQGAVLLGPPTPVNSSYTYNGVAVIDRGWNATMVVPGDPRAVMTDLRAQAEAAGLRLQPGDDHEGGMGKVDAYCRDADRGYVCAARGSRGAGDEADFIDVEIVRRAGTPGSPPVSHLWLGYSDSDRPLLDPFTTDPNLPLGPEPPPVPDDWDPLPVAGERALVGVLPDEFPGIEILEGTRVIGPAADPQGYAGYDLHVAIDDPPPEQPSKALNDQSETPAQGVAYRYARDTVEALGGSELWWDDPTITTDGSLVRRVSVDEAGGFKFDFLVTEPTDGPAWLTITTGYD